MVHQESLALLALMDPLGQLDLLVSLAPLEKLGQLALPVIPSSALIQVCRSTT
ncbi:hypothetical protein [Cyanobium sp. WKJ7-Wakatipu]|uniref:hypothetical protein n=1 Tax=Cyanobium sp. WKJ7-Wakatipu TaxID=2823726 RepID=UPI0020CC4EC9|nr:hypothetical protein [Cyanobium sp. WKJ7-Wakatipu]